MMPLALGLLWLELRLLHWVIPANEVQAGLPCFVPAAEPAGS